LVKSLSGEMPFLEHLEELRWRVIKSVVAVVLCAVPCGIFWKRIFDIIMIYPLRFADPKPKLIYTSPAESIILSIKIALASGILLSVPLIFYQLWKFVSPGLYGKEKKVVFPVVIVSTLFFMAGVTFSYFTFPFLMKFLTSFAADRLDPFFKAGDYFGFLLKISLSFGVVFELPVISYVLARLGLITAGFLMKNFRYALLGIFVLAAVLTPPDILSQLMLALPLIFLYGVSVVVAYFASKEKKTS